MALFPSQPHPFTKVDIEAFPVGRKGCYGLYKKDVWVYIGKGDIRERMLRHIDGDNPCIVKQAPTYWVYVVTPDMDETEKKLIEAAQPICNKKVG